MKARFFLSCFSALLISFAQNAYCALPADWSGPESKVIYDDKGAAFSIDGVRYDPRYIFPAGIRYSTAEHWAGFEYQSTLAKEHGMPIVCVTAGDNSPEYEDLIIQHLKAIGSPNIILYFGARDPEPWPDSRKMKGRSFAGNETTGTYQYNITPDYETISDDWTNRMKVHVRNMLDHYNSHYPGKVIGMHFAALCTAEWFIFPKRILPDVPTGELFYFDYSTDAISAFSAAHPGLSTPSVRERSTANYGNYFLSASDVIKKAAIEYERFLSERTTKSMIELARYAKELTNNKIMVMYFYGYLNELNRAGCLNSSFSADMQNMLDSPYIDVLMAPYSYGFSRGGSAGDIVNNVNHKHQALIAHSPLDPESLYKVWDPVSSTYKSKMWLTEDDTRTYLANIEWKQRPVKNPGEPEDVPLGEYSGLNMGKTIEVLRRNIITSGLHQNGMHFIDVSTCKGWFGWPAYPTESNEMWDGIKRATDQAGKVRFGSSNSYVPEVAVFVDDDSSALELLAPDTSVDPYARDNYDNMRNRLMSRALEQLTQIGTPVRQYMVSDLLRPEFPADKIKFAVFLNTFKISDAVRGAINTKLKAGGKTLLFVYAAGLAKDDDILNPVNIGDITGIKKADGTSAIIKGAGGYNLLNSVTYGGSTYPYGQMRFNVEPWFYVDTAAVSTGLTVLGTYTGGSADGKRSAVLRDFGTHKVIYSGSPYIPRELYRKLAAGAGVTIFSSNPNDIVEAAGKSIMIYADAIPTDSTPRQITFPRTIKSVEIQRNYDEGRIDNVNSNVLTVWSMPSEVFLLHWTAAEDPTASITSTTPVTVNVGQSVQFTGTGTPYSGRTINGYAWRAVNTQTGGSINISAAGSFSYGFTSAGIYRVYFMVKDNQGVWSTEAVTPDINVVFVNVAPVAGTVTPASGSSYVNEEKIFTATYSDDNGSEDLQYCHIRVVNTANPSDQACFYYDHNNKTLYDLISGTGGKTPGVAGTIDSGPGKATLNCGLTTVTSTANCITITWAITFKDTFAGTVNVQLASVDDAGINTGHLNRGTWTVQVLNRPPVLAWIGPKSTNENVTLAFTATATDLDPSPVFYYSLTNAPVGAIIDLFSGVFSWTPGYDLGRTTPPYYATVNVIDGQGGSDSETIAITVNNVNRLPDLAAIGPKPVNEGSALTFTVSASDPDTGDTLTYWTSTPLPGTAAFNASTKQFTWTTTYADAGTYPVTFYVKDQLNAQDSETVTITVYNVNRPPEISNIGGATDIPCGGTLTLNVTARDLDNETLIYSALRSDGSALPAHASITQAGVFTFAPDNTQAGTYAIRFTVSDGSLSVYRDVNITVTAISSFSINGGSANAAKRVVTLDVSCPGLAAPVQARFSNDNVTWTAWEAYSASGRAWKTTRGYGTKTVYAQLKDGAGDIKPIMSDTIDLSYTKPVIAMDLDNDLKDDYVVSFGQTGAFMYSSKDCKWYEVAKGIEVNYIVKADLNGDGTENDILADFSIPGSPYNGVWIKKNGQDWVQLAGVNTQGLVAADINNDSKDEAVCYFPDNGGVHVYTLSTGAWTPWALPGVWSMTVCDADNNGIDDVIFDFKDANGLYIFMNSASWVEMARGCHGEWIEAGDVDGDFNDEAVIDFGATGLYTWDREKAQPWTKVSNSAKDPMAFTLANIYSDGYKDILSVFGMPAGVEKYDAITHIWSDYDPDNNFDCEYMISGESNGTSKDEVVIAVEGSGVYVKYDDTGGWVPMAGIDAQ